MNEINEIKIPEGVESISVTQHDDKVVIKFIPEKPKFKEGDFVYEDGRIMIVKNYPNSYYALIYPKLDMEPVYNRRYAPAMPLSPLSFRYATEEEEQLLIDAMKKDGKWWNAEKLTVEDIPQPNFKVGDEVIIKKGISSESHRGIFPCFTRDLDDYIGQKLVISNVQWHTSGVYLYGVDENMYRFLEDWLEPYAEELKKGDLAIFWDDNKDYAIIRIYNIKGYSYHSDSYGHLWKNAIKFESKEQFEKVLRGEI